MANILRAMNGETEPQSNLVLTEAERIAQDAGRKAHHDPKVDAMKVILEAFQGAGAEPVEAAPRMNAPKSVRQPVRESAKPYDPFCIPDREAAEAYVTEPTERGVRIGAWEIRANPGKAGKTYDVVSESGEVVIAKGLYLYDAALGLTRRLNEGAAINDPAVRDLLALEDNYAKRLIEASQMKARAKKLRERGDDLRANVAEDRQDEAERQALDAHDRLLKLAGIR
jgi:hypothetical protein